MSTDTGDTMTTLILDLRARIADAAASFATWFASCVALWSDGEWERHLWDCDDGPEITAALIDEWDRWVVAAGVDCADSAFVQTRETVHAVLAADSADWRAEDLPRLAVDALDSAVTAEAWLHRAIDFIERCDLAATHRAIDESRQSDLAPEAFATEVARRRVIAATDDPVFAQRGGQTLSEILAWLEAKSFGFVEAPPIVAAMCGGRVTPDGLVTVLQVEAARLRNVPGYDGGIWTPARSLPVDALVSPAVDFSDEAYNASMDEAGLESLGDDGIAFLRDRGIAPAVAAARGVQVGGGAHGLPDPGAGRYWSRAVKDHASGAGVTYLILWWHTRTGPVPQIRWLPGPRVSAAGTDDEQSHKYDFAASERDDDGRKIVGRVIDVKWFDPAQAVHVIAEGQGKVDHLATRLPGQSVIGIAGVDGGALGRGKGDLRSVADLASEFIDAVGGHDVIANARFVAVPDADVTTNRNVFEAIVGRLCASLVRRKAEVDVVLVPGTVYDPVARREVPVAPGGDGGVDDHGVVHDEHYPEDRTLTWRMIFDRGAGYLVSFDEAMRRYGRDYANTDAGRGEALADEIGSRGDRYLPATREWRVWNGRFHQIDGEGVALFRAARECARRAWGASKSDTAKVRAGNESNARMRAAIEQAKSHPAIHGSLADLQPRGFSHFWPAANGTVNLRTGGLEADVWHREHLNPFVGDVEYLPGATHPVWERFLRQTFVTKVDAPRDGVEYLRDKDGVAFEYDEAKVRMVQEYAGTWLTSRNFRLGVIFLGAGQAGLGTFVEACARVMSESVVGTLPAEALTTKFGGHNQFTTSRCPGMRLMRPSEMSERMVLDEAWWKSFTQDMEPIDVEEKGKQPRKVLVTWSFVLMTNELPALERKGRIDNSTRSRSVIVTFPRALSNAQKAAGVEFIERLSDRDVKEAILAWMVEGAVRFYAAGEVLTQTEESRRMVDAWLTKGDMYAPFIAACLAPRKADDGSSRPLTKASLYQVYCRWAEDQGWTSRVPKARFLADIQARPEFGTAKRGKTACPMTGDRVDTPARWTEWTLSNQGRKYLD